MSSFKKEMINGLFWSAVEKYSGLFIGIIISMILARILGPEEYGVVAIATVLIHFMSMFCTMGIGPAIIQRQDLTCDDNNNIFTFSIYVGLVLSILFFLSSWPISWFYDKPDLIPVCQILTICLFFGAVNMVPNALMMKNRRFKLVAKRTLLLQLLSGMCAIIAAYNGLSFYSLLISPVFTSVGIFIYNSRHYKLRFIAKPKIEPIKRIYSYSVYQFLFEFINFFSRNLDKLLIGKCMSASSLGYYEKAYRLVQLPQNQITSVINPVMQPLMSTLQEDMDQMSQKHNRIVKFISTISFPVSIILYFCGNEIVTLFYGSHWEESISTFQILSLSLSTQMILSTSGGIWQSCNATNYLFWTGLANTCITITGFVIAATFVRTIESFAVAWTTTAVINFFITYFFMHKDVLHSSLSKFLFTLVNPVINSLILICLFVPIQYMLINENHIVSLIIKLSLSSLVTIIFIQITKRYNILLGIKTIINKK